MCASRYSQGLSLSCFNHTDTAFLQVLFGSNLGHLSKPAQFDAVEIIEKKVDGEIIEKPDKPKNKSAIRELLSINFIVEKLATLLGI